MIISKIQNILVVLILAAGMATRAAAAAPGTRPAAAGVPFDIEAWLAKKEPAYMAPIVVSADGKWLAIMMTGVVSEGSAGIATLPKEGTAFKTASEDLAGSEVFVVERATGKVTRPFQKFAGSFCPAWSPTENKLSLAVQDSPVRYPRVATWSPGDVAPRVFAEARFRASIGFAAPTWTPDGKRIVFPLVQTSSKVPPRLVYTVVNGPGENKATDIEISDETLAVLDVAKSEIKPFKNLGPLEYTHVWGFRISPDGKRAAFLASVPQLQKGIDVNWVRLTTVDLESGAVQAMGEAQMEGWGLGFSWSPDGRHIAWQAAPGADVVPDNPEKLLIATVDGAAAVREVAVPKASLGGHLHAVDASPLAPPVWAEDGGSFWLIGKGALLHVAVDGSILPDVPLPEEMGGADWLENAMPTFAPVHAHAIASSADLYIRRKKEIECVNLRAAPSPTIKSIATTADDERAVDWASAVIFTLKHTANRGCEVMQTSLKDGASSRLAVVNAGLPKFEYGQTKTLSWKSVEGGGCKGTLLLPVGWKDGDKPPVVMDVYGGDKGKGGKKPDALSEECLIINPHLLGVHGYAFFKPDMPQTKEEPAASLARSADAAADALRASGFVDPDRIAVVGQSYGGYTALCVATGSKKFKAAIVANGVYDLPRADTDGWMLSGWVEGGQGLMNATLWEKTQRYIDNSPLYALAKLEAPLLVVQGDADDISKNQGPALMNSLQRLGKPAEFLVGADMDHVPIAWSVETQRELIPKVLAFLDANIKTQALNKKPR